MNRAHRLRGPGGERVVIVGGILGLEADAEILQSEFDRERPNSVLLGVPYEDLDAVRGKIRQDPITERAVRAIRDIACAQPRHLELFDRRQSIGCEAFLLFQHLVLEISDAGHEKVVEARPEHGKESHPFQ